MITELWDDPKLFDRWKELARFLLKEAEDSWLTGTPCARDNALLFFNSEEFVYWCECAGCDHNKARKVLLDGNLSKQSVFNFADSNNEPEDGYLVIVDKRPQGTLDFY